MVKKFALLSFSVLCLAIAALIVNNLVTRDVQAQAGGVIIAYSGAYPAHYVITPDGDMYYNNQDGGPSVGEGACQTFAFHCPATYIGNFWTGEMGTVPVSPETWGKIKGLYDRNK